MHMPNLCMKERLLAEPEVWKSKTCGRSIWKDLLIAYSQCLISVLYGLFLVLDSETLGILFDIQYNSSWPSLSCNLWLSIWLRFFQRQASKFLFVDSCRARAQLSSAVLNTFWFQKLTKILSSAQSLTNKKQIYTIDPLHNMRLLWCRCKWILFYKVLSIVSRSKGDLLMYISVTSA